MAKITNKPRAEKSCINLWDDNKTFLDDLVAEGFIHDRTHGINYILNQVDKNKRVQQLMFPKAI